jgi:hypothetical protein
LSTPAQARILRRFWLTTLKFERTAMDRDNGQGSLGATITAVLVLTGTVGVLYLPLFL